MAKIVEERIAEPDDPIYQTGWTLAWVANILPKESEAIKHYWQLMAMVSARSDRDKKWAAKQIGPGAPINLARSDNEIKRAAHEFRRRQKD